MEKYIKRGVPQGTMLGRLLFLLHVNDLPNSSNVLVPIMFTDYTNLFFERSNLNTLFKTNNDELIKINEWFSASKQSLNIRKYKFSLLINQVKNTASLPIQMLKINNHDIERVNTTEFLVALLHENLSWKENRKYLQSKIRKSIELMYKAKIFLDKESLLALYYSYIHSYLKSC